MGIIFKFILKNVWGKKLRTLLIILSITISTALIFSSQAIGNTMVKMTADRQKEFYGQADISIQAGSSSPSQFLSLDSARDFSTKIIGLTWTTAICRSEGKENFSVVMMGFDIKEFNEFYNVSYSKESNIEPFSGQKVIIGSNTASAYSINIGDKLDFYFGGKSYIFDVCAIANPTGIFTEMGSSVVYVAIPKDFITKLYNQDESTANMIFLKLKNPELVTDVISSIRGVYPGSTVRQTVNQVSLKRTMDNISTPFIIMSIVLAFMSVYIIYSSFKVITIERLPIIGTFRSIGATRGMTQIVLMAESAVYGVIGALVGCGLGIVILYVMSYFSRPDWQKGFSITIQFTSSQLIISFIAALVLCIISSIMPIVRVSMIPVKDIVMGTGRLQKGNKKWKLILAVVFLLTAVALPPFVSDLPVNTACVLLAMFSAILFVPYVVKLFVLTSDKVFGPIFGNESILAVNNLRDNKGILNSISLLIIGVSVLLMINTISYSVLKEIGNIYSNARFDIMLYAQNSNEAYLNQIKQVDGVSDAYGLYTRSNVEVLDKDDRIGSLHGVDEKYFEFWNYDIPGGTDAALNELNSGRVIIVTNVIKEIFGLNAGDTIMLRIGNNYIAYTVSNRFFNSNWSNEELAFISSDNLKQDYKAVNYSRIDIKSSGDVNQVIANIKNNTYNRISSISSLKQIVDSNIKSNAQMFNILKGFVILTLIIGIIGVVNNLMISFIERRRAISVLKSIGMSKKQTIKMIFIESLAGGIIGSTIALIISFIALNTVKSVLKSMDISIPIHYSVVTVILSFVAGVLIMIMASISPALKSSKLNIIEGIKYE